MGARQLSHILPLEKAFAQNYLRWRLTGWGRARYFRAMYDALASIPPPQNEPVLTYAPGAPERARLKATLARMSSEVIDLPLVIGGKAVETGTLREVRAPHRHSLLLGRCHQAGTKEAEA